MMYINVIIGQALKKLGFEIDSESKNFIINGDRSYLEMVIRKLQKVYDSEEMEDSLDTINQKPTYET